MNKRKIAFFVEGKAQPKQRARITKFGNYTPKETANYENLVKIIAIQAMKGKDMFTTAIELSLTFYQPIPKYISTNKKKMQAVENGELLPSVKPDIDNLVKSIKDALNGVVWKDDALVCKLTAEKKYGKPTVFIEVKEL